MNREIRAAILADIQKNGARKTRDLNSTYSNLFNTSKQRICGNISFLITSGAVTIVRNRPNSYIY